MARWTSPAPPSTSTKTPARRASPPPTSSRCSEVAPSSRRGAPGDGDAREGSGDVPPRSHAACTRGRLCEDTHYALVCIRRTFAIRYFVVVPAREDDLRHGELYPRKHYSDQPSTTSRTHPAGSDRGRGLSTRHGDAHRDDVHVVVLRARRVPVASPSRRAVALARPTSPSPLDDDDDDDVGVRSGGSKGQRKGRAADPAHPSRRRPPRNPPRGAVRHPRRRRPRPERPTSGHRRVRLGDGKTKSNARAREERDADGRLDPTIHHERRHDGQHRRVGDGRGRGDRRGAARGRGERRRRRERPERGVRVAQIPSGCRRVTSAPARAPRRRRRRRPDAEDHAEVRVEDAEPRAAVHETADERRGVAEPEEEGRDRRSRGIVGEDARVVPAARDGWFIAQDAAGDVPGR